MSNEQFGTNQIFHQSILATSCSKQGLDMDHPSYCSFGTVPVNASFSPSAGFNDPYNICFQSGSLPCTQQNCLAENFPQCNEAWDNKTKQNEKVDSIELLSKELSPASYCSNIEIFTNEANYYKVDNQWYYNTNNVTNIQNLKTIEANQDLPSCAKMTKEKLNTWSGSKNSPTNLPRSHPSSQLQNTQHNTNFPEQNVDCQYNICCYNKTALTNVNYIQNELCNNANIPFESITSTIDQQTECSNEESDIVVEESDEEQTDYSEEHEKVFQVNRCLLCNITYKPLGMQFFYLTSKNPLTMSSQTPVLFKLGDILGHMQFPKTYLCCDCLSLLNAFDNLQFQIENIRKEIIDKFDKTCNMNSIQHNQIKKENKEPKSRQCRIKKSLRFKCKICSKILSLKTYLNYHVKKHTNKGYLCEICGSKFRNRRLFIFHRKHHLKNRVTKIRSYHCSNCNKIFRTKSNKKEHENFCLGIFPYECRNQYCDKKFTSATKLKNHVKLKHDKKFIAICSICNIGFVKVSDYKSHKITHSTDKKFSCEKCEKSYKTLSNLNFHMKLHGENLPFICLICNKGFMRKEYLEAHINNHNGIKKFKCTVCEKQFVSQKNLDSHLKYHEGTVKTKICNICGKRMTTGYEEHLRIHNNLREFECELCDFRFNTKGALYKHKKKKHMSENLDNHKTSIIHT